MSAITIENDLVHYEVLGRGRPVILLHGWLGSWRYWVPSMQQLSMKYRTYALDLWGFGDSGRDPKRYNFDSQVALLHEFMEKLGITKAALVGHSLGASICARYAVQHPDRVPRLMVVAPPLFWMAPTSRPLTANPLPALPSSGASTPATGDSSSDQVHPEAETMPVRTEDMKARIKAAMEQRAREIGEQRLAPKSPREAATPPTDTPATEIEKLTGKTTPPLPEPLASVPAMPRADAAAPDAARPPDSAAPDAASGDVQRANPLKDHLEVLDRMELLKRHVDAGADLEKLKVEVDKADSVALAMSIESFSEVDTLRDLRALSMPLVAVYGGGDTFVPPPDARMITSLTEGRSTCGVIGMDSLRHFPMLENTAGFTRLLLDFLEIPDVTKLTIKETWERRVR
jgi:pimeloyl-ACP methyl ester carboxylesterase